MSGMSNRVSGKSPAELKEMVGKLPRSAGRSSLFDWMHKNRAEFAAELGSRPDWSNWAVVFGTAGLLDRTDKPPTGRTARITWWKVRIYAKKLDEAGAPPIRPTVVVRSPPDPPKKRLRPAPSLVIPDPPVMPPDVRMLAKDVPARVETSVHAASDKVKEALRMLAQENSWLPRRSD